MICSNCGREYTENQGICEACGVELDNVIEVNTMDGRVITYVDNTKRDKTLKRYEGSNGLAYNLSKPTKNINCDTCITDGADCKLWDELMEKDIGLYSEYAFCHANKMFLWTPKNKKYCKGCQMNYAKGCARHSEPCVRNEVYYDKDQNKEGWQTVAHVETKPPKKRQVKKYLKVMDSMKVDKFHVLGKGTELEFIKPKRKGVSRRVR